MGNCNPSPRRYRSPPEPPATPPLKLPSQPPTPLAVAAAAPESSPLATPGAASSAALRIYGSEACPVAWRLRVALLYKGVAPRFIPSEAAPLGRPVLRLAGGEEVSGSVEELLRLIDACLPEKPDASPPGRAGPDQASVAAMAAAEVAEAVKLQHQSMQRHVESVTAKVTEMAASKVTDIVGGKGRKKAVAVAPPAAEGAEARRAVRWYGEVVEIMLEHARMEEQLLFPAMERAARPGVCQRANEQHGRQLPMMNGIKEDMKTLLTLQVGTSLYREVLLSISFRLRSLQEHCKEHFADEERDLLPRLESAYRMRREEGDITNLATSGWAAEVMGAMTVTHSRLFPFFMAGLLPQEAMQYIDLVFHCIRDTRQLVSMLRSLAAQLEEANPAALVHTNPLKLYEQLFSSSP